MMATPVVDRAVENAVVIVTVALAAPVAVVDLVVPAVLVDVAAEAPAATLELRATPVDVVALPAAATEVN